MTITDIIALAKQGYKPGDIKELIELASSSEDQHTDEQGQEQSVPADPAPDDPEPEQGDEPKQENDPEPDYKSMYEELKKETQRKNVRSNSQTEPEKTLDEKMADLIRSIY